MGEWKTVFEGEVEGRLVMVKVYESEDAADENTDPAVRVTTTAMADHQGCAANGHRRTRGGRHHNHP